MALLQASRENTHYWQLKKGTLILEVIKENGKDQISEEKVFGEGKIVLKKKPAE